MSLNFGKFTITYNPALINNIPQIHIKCSLQIRVFKCVKLIANS